MTSAALARLIATCGGAGYLKPAPGTWGSLVGLVFGLIAIGAGGALAGVVLALIALAAGTWAAGQYTATLDATDPGEVVIDEAAAIVLVLALVPAGLLSFVFAFGLFRLFDIWKPWPVSWAERTFAGPVGIMADDLVAGLLTVALIWLANLLLLA